MSDPNHPVRVLVIDDQPEVADPVAELLRARGAHACAVYRGADAVVAAADDPPDVALVALALPVLDGFGLALWLRKQAPRALLAAVAERWEEGLGERCAAVGFDALLFKPLTLSELDGLLGRAREPR